MINLLFKTLRSRKKTYKKSILKLKNLKELSALERTG